MNKCIHLKQKTKNKKRIVYCNLLKKEIDLNECKNCNHKEYKKVEYKPIIARTALKAKSTLKAKTKLKTVTKKHIKNEKNRKSIFVDNFDYCIECHKSKKEIKIDKHEIFGGSRRQTSIKWDMVIPLCRNCHECQETIIKWQNIGQAKFVQLYSYNTFMSEFKLDYIFKQKKD